MQTVRKMHGTVPRRGQVTKSMISRIKPIDRIKNLMNLLSNRIDG